MAKAASMPFASHIFVFARSMPPRRRHFLRHAAQAAAVHANGAANYRRTTPFHRKPSAIIRLFYAKQQWRQARITPLRPTPTAAILRY